MAKLSDHFTDEQLQPIFDGLHQFGLLTGLIYDPSPLVWNKWFTDEGDLKSALRSVRDAFKNTKTMVGKRKYQGVDFNHVKEVNKDLWTFLTSGKDAGETALLKKRNLPMYYLVIEPTINLFSVFSHEEAIEFADEVIAGVISLVDTACKYGDYADALVAQETTKRLIHDREEAKKAEASSKKKRKKVNRDPFLELLASVATEVSDEAEEDEKEQEEFFS